MINNLLQNWPALLVLFAGIAGAVGVYVSTAEQGRLQTKLIEKTIELEKVQKRNIELAEDNAKISKNLVHQVTGGDSIPYIEFLGNDFVLRHQSGKFPLFNLRISITEVWWPLDGEKFPSTFWTKKKIPISLNKDIISTPYRNIINFETPLLLPNKSVLLKGYNFDFDKVLFPETNKCHFVIQIAARNGNFTQYVASRRTTKKIKDKKESVVEVSTLLLNENGDKISGDGEWIKGEPIIYPKTSTIYSHDLMLRVWP